MNKRFIGPLFFAFFSNIAFSQQTLPTSNIVMFDLKHNEEKLELSNPIQVTSREGYDNQPYFSLTGDSIYYTSIDDNEQADIKCYNWKSKKTRWITQTPESEYSAVELSGNNAISTVRVEADGTQRLWQMPLSAAGKNKMIFSDIQPVGYYTWIGNFDIALFVLGEPHRLEWVRLPDKEKKLIATDIGRSLHKVPGSQAVSYIQNQDTGNIIRQYSLKTREYEDIVRALPESQDFVWTPDGVLLMAQRSRLFKYKPSQPDWKLVKDFSTLGIENITRLAVHPKGHKIALVHDGFMKSRITKIDDVMATAKSIAYKNLIIDTHIDLPYRLQKQYEDISNFTETGDFDYPRAIQGGLTAPFMSIYIPAEYEQKGSGKELADQLIDRVEKIVKKHKDKFALAYSTQQLQENFNQGLISLPMGMENGTPIEGKLKNLKHFYERGIRYITLAHSQSNHISDSSYDPNRQWNGLSDFGKKLIQAMNNLGVMIDVSHLSDEAFEQVMKLSQVPVIASHSSARHFTPGFERNMSDEMIKHLAKNGGVIQINFGSTFISEKSRASYEIYKAEREKFLQANQVELDSEEVKEFTKAYRKKHPFVYASIEEVLDHFEHVIKLVGVEHVGIGSDYDGVGDSLPEGLKDVSYYPQLIAGFLQRGYSEREIKKILNGNLLRVWKEVEEYAKKQS